jgi:hypothetical protein
VQFGTSPKTPVRSGTDQESRSGSREESGVISVL